jgi:hypothetical protein
MRTIEAALIGLQVFQVLFLAVHDWVPLGKLNDVDAVRRADTRGRLIRVTFIQTVPYAIGLFYSVRAYGHAWPGWLDWYLWISYGLLFIGQLRAWWAPYLLRPEPIRAERYREMFGNTSSFLPVRNEMVPNTAHISLHVATLATLVLLWIR